MHCSTGRIWQDYGASGILYDVGSVYEGLLQLTDMRKAKGKIYQLEMVLLIVLLAKLCGEDGLLGIAEWGKHRQEVRWIRLFRVEKELV